MVRGLSASSTRSVPSAYALMSDNDHESVTTRTTSPSPPPHMTHEQNAAMLSKPTLPHEPVIVGTDVIADDAEKHVEADLGRRRCIKFACANAPINTATKSPTKVEAQKTASVASAEPVKRKCALTFDCPARAPTGTRSMISTPCVRPVTATAASSPGVSTVSSHVSDDYFSPKDTSMPSVSSPIRANNNHEGLASSHMSSPMTFRKMPMLVKRRTYSVDHEDSTAEARRYHVFGSNSAVEDAWMNETNLTGAALTIRDTLHKENLIRQLGEEAHQEAMEDDEAELSRVASHRGGDDDDDNDSNDENDDDENGDSQDEDASDDDDNDEIDEIDEARGDDFDVFSPTNRSNSMDDMQEEEEQRGRQAAPRPESSRVSSKSAQVSLPAGIEVVSDPTEAHAATASPKKSLAERRSTHIRFAPLGLGVTSKQSRDPLDAEASAEVGHFLEHGHKAKQESRSRQVSRTREHTLRNSQAQHSSIDRVVSRSPLPGRTKHNRSPAPHCRRLFDTHRRLRSPALRGKWQSTSTSTTPPPDADADIDEDDPRRLSDPGTPAQPISVHCNVLAHRPSVLATSSLPRGTSAIRIRGKNEAVAVLDDTAGLTYSHA